MIMQSVIINSILLSLIFFYLSNLQKSFILRIIGRIISVAILIYSLQLLLWSDGKLNIWQKIKPSPATQQKIADKLTPQPVQDAKQKIEETFKKLERETFNSK